MDIWASRSTPAFKKKLENFLFSKFFLTFQNTRLLDFDILSYFILLTYLILC